MWRTINDNCYINGHIYLNFFPILKVTHNLSAPISANKCTAETIMSVSFAIISMRLQPCETTFAACSMTLVSNSP